MTFTIEPMITMGIDRPRDLARRVDCSHVRRLAHRAVRAHRARHRDRRRRPDAVDAHAPATSCEIEPALIDSSTRRCLTVGQRAEQFESGRSRSKASSSWTSRRKSSVGAKSRKPSAAITATRSTRSSNGPPPRSRTSPTSCSDPAALSASLVNRNDAGHIQRTLLLAQRAADNAMAEAEEQARVMVEESEAKAHTLVSDAEANARRIHDDETRRARRGGRRAPGAARSACRPTPTRSSRTRAPTATGCGPRSKPTSPGSA